MVLLALDKRNMSHGGITGWRWDFGDGNQTAEQHRIHTYTEPGEYVVTLYIEGPVGKARHTKVRTVAVK